MATTAAGPRPGWSAAPGIAGSASAANGERKAAKVGKRGLTRLSGSITGALATIGVTAAIAALIGATVGALLGRPIMAVPVGVALASVVSILVIGEHRRLRKSVMEPIDGLVRSVELMDHGVRVDPNPGGPDEVRRLAGGVRRMTARLDAATYGVRQRDERLADYDGDVDNIVRMSRLLAGSFNLSFILRTTAVAALELTKLPRAVVWMIDQERLVARYDTAAPDVLAPSLEPVALGVGRVGGAALTNAVVAEPSSSPTAVPGSPGIAIPLDSRGEVVGVVELVGDVVTDLTARQRRLLAVLAAHAATAMEASRLEARAELLVRTDASTGLANYRQFVSDLNAEVVRCNRYGRPLALLIADIDSFRAFNEVHGRQRGDQVLALVAGLLETEARASDSAYRFGGDEFVVVAREVDAESARWLAERIRIRLRDRLDEVLPGAELTMSFGIADLATAADGAALVGRADEALIRAKALGYDRVVVAGSSRAHAPAFAGETAGAPSGFAAPPGRGG